MSDPRVRCVVFDLDDTLFLERDYVRSGFAAVGRWSRAHLGVDDFGERCWKRFERGTRGHVFDDVLAELGLKAKPELVEQLVQEYRLHDPVLRLTPDAALALNELAGQVALAAVSDGPLESQRAKARAVGLPGRLHPIVFTAELGCTKPDPCAFEPIERAHAVRGDECTYVADNPVKDFAGPRNLGWWTVRVRRPESLHATIESGDEVDLEIENLLSLARRVRSGRRAS